jgi:hypothetical protein
MSWFAGRLGPVGAASAAWVPVCRAERAQHHQPDVPVCRAERAEHAERAQPAVGHHGEAGHGHQAGEEQPKRSQDEHGFRGAGCGSGRAGHGI